MVKFYEQLFAELEIYVKHLAWLNAAPENKEYPQRTSRRDLFEHYKIEIEFPPCDALHILVYLFELGITEGDKPLSHAELKAWMDNTGVELQAYEARFLKRLSETYLAESQKATEQNAQTAWEDAPPQMSAAYLAAQRTRENIRKLAQQ